MAWTVAEVGALVGAITGPIALLVSAKSYALARSVKTLDLRLELKKAYNKLDIALSGIEEFFAHVHQSHTRVAAAIGLLNSGAMVLFEQEFTQDRDRLRGLLATQPMRSTNFERIAAAELVDQIAAIHAFQSQIDDLRAKYQKILDSDDEHRRERRALINGKFP